MLLEVTVTTYNSNLIITPQILNECKKYSEAVVDTNISAYARRGQSNSKNNQKQAQNGKIAEVLVYNQLSVDFPDLTPPDFTIYDKKNKSWASDSSSKKLAVELAIKSQDIEVKQMWGESWVFQYNDGKNYDCDMEIFGKDINPNLYAVFVSLNVPKRSAQIRAIVKVQWLHDKKLFQPMALEKYNSTNNKLAVYYDHSNFNSLIKYPEQLWQL